MFRLSTINELIQHWLHLQCEDREASQAKLTGVSTGDTGSVVDNDHFS